VYHHLRKVLGVFRGFSSLSFSLKVFRAKTLKNPKNPLMAAWRLGGATGWVLNFERETLNRKGNPENPKTLKKKP
jgi:hypothetical protein